MTVRARSGLLGTRSRRVCRRRPSGTSRRRRKCTPLFLSFRKSGNLALLLSSNEPSFFRSKRVSKTLQNIFLKKVV